MNELPTTLSCAIWCDQLGTFRDWLNEQGLKTPELPQWADETPIRVMFNSLVGFWIEQSTERELELWASIKGENISTVPVKIDRLKQMVRLPVLSVDLHKVTAWAIKHKIPLTSSSNLSA